MATDGPAPRRHRASSGHNCVSYQLALCHHGRYVTCWQFETSLWPQTARRRVGAEPSVAIMVFHVQCSIFPFPNARVLPNRDILSRYYQKQTTSQNVVFFSAIISSMLRVLSVHFNLIHIHIQVKNSSVLPMCSGCLHGDDVNITLCFTLHITFIPQANVLDLIAIKCKSLSMHLINQNCIS